MKLPTLRVFALACSLLTVGCWSTPERHSLRVMSFNIHHGEGLDGVFDLERIASTINAQVPDYVALQEVDMAAERSHRELQASALGELTGMEAGFADFMEFQGGHYGLAALLAPEHRLASHSQVVLPPGAEPRSALKWTVVTSSGLALCLVAVHMDWTSADFRLAQVRALAADLEQESLPILILGDLNAAPDDASLRYLIDQGFVLVDKGEDALTFDWNGRQGDIDHLLYRSSPDTEISVEGFRILPRTPSTDHFPLYFDLEFVRRASR